MRSGVELNRLPVDVGDVNPLMTVMQDATVERGFSGGEVLGVELFAAGTVPESTHETKQPRHRAGL